MLIAQISDPHVREPGQLCCGRVDTAAMLARAVDRLNRLDPAPDVVMVTGDLVDGATPAEYAHLRSLLAPLRMPFYLAMGNHDRREPLRAAFADHAHLGTSGFVQYAIDHHAVRLLVLDTNIPDQPAGELCAERLRWLDERLAERPHQPSAIFLHHPPFATGNVSLDRFDLSGVDGLREVVARRRNVEGIFSGHLHRAIQTRFAGTLAMSCPSTAHQLHVSLGERSVMGFDLEPPACLLHTWDGRRLATYTLLIDGFPGPFSLEDGQPLALTRGAPGG